MSLHKLLSFLLLPKTNMDYLAMIFVWLIGYIALVLGGNTTITSTIITNKRGAATTSPPSLTEATTTFYSTIRLSQSEIQVGFASTITTNKVTTSLINLNVMSMLTSSHVSTATATTSSTATTTLTTRIYPTSIYPKITTKHSTNNSFSLFGFNQEQLRYVLYAAFTCTGICITLLIIVCCCYTHKIKKLRRQMTKPDSSVNMKSHAAHSGSDNQSFFELKTDSRVKPESTYEVPESETYINVDGNNDTTDQQYSTPNSKEPTPALDRSTAVCDELTNGVPGNETSDTESHISPVYSNVSACSLDETNHYQELMPNRDKDGHYSSLICKKDKEVDV